MLIESIKSPKDVKKLSIIQLFSLCKEIRDAIILKCSVSGGHIGPNLGVVELTVALHYVFDSPIDKIVFDVSHQSYCHKILTGRANCFLKREHFDDVSGYTNPNESEHDLFNIGHTSTSVSLAVGLAKARDLKGTKENIVAVIGDGALSGGEAYEGLNNGAELGTNFIVVINDNGMSIAENHGGLYKHLSDLRASYGTCENNYFKCLGYDYYYIDDGNDVSKIIPVFSAIKDIKHPVVIHIHTKKGFGYPLAITNQEEYHWKPPFNISNGENIKRYFSENYDDLTNNFLLEKMSKDSSVVALVAAVPATIGFSPERRKMAGKQFVDVGIAEEHGIAMSAGIAKNGGKPIFATHSSFYQRTYDQISQEICINNLPVTLLVRNASIWGLNDVTHLGIFDIPLLSNIPNLVYMAPTNCEEYLSMLDWSIEQDKHPVAIRIPRNGVYHTSFDIDYDYSNINRFKVIKAGKTIAVIALGDFFQLGEKICSEIFETFGFAPTLINPRFISGLDKELLNRIAKTHKVVITLEDGILDGGFGQKIASFYGTSKMIVLNYGLEKRFIDRYSPTEILEKCRIKPSLIIEDLNQILNK